MVLERTITVDLMVGTTIYCSVAMIKLQKNIFIKRARARARARARDRDRAREMARARDRDRARDQHSRRPATVAQLVEQPIKNLEFKSCYSYH